MTGRKKEKWGKPKLIILTRGKPDEAILGFCKSAAAGPGPANTSCWVDEPGFICVSETIS